ncbi:MAG: hypothetical protein CL402_00750 [Acidiferrobacteraceae bacterium]|nr:hypothetical protein [Acidiferrobacteraceae bacterium]|tara:strand:- start:27003 stop:27182 length:180 start_codon:yes stop_codon:yes gene_type:complete
MKKNNLSGQLTYQEARKKGLLSGQKKKSRLPRSMILIVFLLEISAMGGMAYLVYMLYFS